MVMYASRFQCPWGAWYEHMYPLYNDILFGVILQHKEKMDDAMKNVSAYPGEAEEVVHSDSII